MGFMEQLLGQTAHEPTAEEIFRASRDGLIDHLRTGATECNETLRGMFGASYRIDEMAVMLGNHHDAMILITTLIELEGFELFNAAKDIVATTPIPSRYAVQYWFVRTPWDFRIEVMTLGEGFSPIHSALEQQLRMQNHGVGAVHASFKVPDEEQYAMAVHHLQKNGYALQQHCKSDYGRFSYFGPVVDYEAEEDETINPWTIKPRMNLRDGGS